MGPFLFDIPDSGWVIGLLRTKHFIFRLFFTFILQGEEKGLQSD